MRIIRYILIILKACNPLNPDLSLTWKEAWKKSKRNGT